MSTKDIIESCEKFYIWRHTKNDSVQSIYAWCPVVKGYTMVAFWHEPKGAWRQVDYPDEDRTWSSSIDRPKFECKEISKDEVLLELI